MQFNNKSIYAYISQLILCQLSSFYSSVQLNTDVNETYFMIKSWNRSSGSDKSILDSHTMTDGKFVFQSKYVVSIPKLIGLFWNDSYDDMMRSPDAYQDNDMQPNQKILKYNKTYAYNIAPSWAKTVSV